MTASAVVAAFDLDGTLTTGDTFVPFLVRAGGASRTGRALGASAWRWLRDGRDVAKATAVRRVLEGLSAETVAALGRAHADALVAGGVGPGRRLRPAVVDRLHQHRSLGHRVVIVSASLRVYVEPLARSLGVSDVIATEVDVDAGGILTGELRGQNCRGLEKVTRLDLALALDWSTAWAYGDSEGDRPLLERAAHGVWVRRGRLDGPAPG